VPRQSRSSIIRVVAAVAPRRMFVTAGDEIRWRRERVLRRYCRAVWYALPSIGYSNGHTVVDGIVLLRTVTTLPQQAQLRAAATRRYVVIVHVFSVVQRHVC